MTNDAATEPIINAQDSGAVKWFKDNNPLYLLSVLFMLIGLHLVSSDARNSSLTINGLLAFFAVQNLYEIAMVGMALYLLKQQIQPRHGKLLLAFVLLFLGDVTFYQVRISGMSFFYGNLATGLYFLLAVIKFAAVIKVLKLTIYHWRIFYVMASFALIWVGPKIAYVIMDTVGKTSSPYFDATTFIYLLWLIAGLIHLPVIIEHWQRNQMNEEQLHALVGNETSFWRYLMLFPFFMLPIQLFLNVMADSSLTIAGSTPKVAIMLPWIIMAGFFVQTFWKKEIRQATKINHFDSVLLIFSLIVAMASSDAELIPVIINYTLVVAGLVVTCYTRQNLVNGLAIGAMLTVHAGQQVLTGVNKAVDYGSQLSRTAWAAILMAGSFIMLAIGFLVSLFLNGKKNLPSVESQNDHGHVA
jgi:hypothetical protein